MTTTLRHLASEYGQSLADFKSTFGHLDATLPLPQPDESIDTITADLLRYWYEESLTVRAASAPQAFSLTTEARELPALAAVAFRVRLCRRVAVAYGDRLDPLLPIIERLESLCARGQDPAATNSREVGRDLEVLTVAARQQRDQHRAHRPPIFELASALGHVLAALVEVFAGRGASELEQYFVAADTDIQFFAGQGSTSTESRERRLSFLYYARKDLRLLRAVAQAEHWSDQHPVGPGFFGPIFLSLPYPLGVYAGFASPSDAVPPLLNVTIQVPENTSDAEVLNLVRQFVTQADDLHRAYGGRGLRVLSTEVFQASNSQAAVPQ